MAGVARTTWYYTLLAGVAFSYVLLTNYALLHEASHDNLNSDPRLNYLLGVAAGLLFPMPLSMILVLPERIAGVQGGGDPPRAIVPASGAM